jgi:DNA polymerase-4
MRKIIHVDMDCFYAAVEEREQPELRGRAVAVGGQRGGRGVLTTCNYVAREFGIRSAMPTFQAVQRCPQLIIVPPRFELYRTESARVRAILAGYTALIEPLSLDEAYLDVSGSDRPATAIAREIRERIFEVTGLTASAGIAPNKMLAKIASDFRKPNGQHTVRPEAIDEFMRELPARKIPGIGEVMAGRLAEIGVESCGQLQAFAREDLIERFGKFGGELYDRCRGIDDRPVESGRKRKSLSNERTFSANLTSLADCRARLDDLFSELCEDLERHAAGRAINKIFVKLRFADFSRTTVERGGDQPVLSQCRALLEEGWLRREPEQRSVRLLGVGVRFASEEAPERRRLPVAALDADQLQLALEITSAGCS